MPHVYATGAAAYRQLQATLKNQAVLISGESGAGKTETTKKVLSFLAAVASAPGTSSSEPGIEEKILQSNPLLESLGNAKTLRNDNSSRFGKWMKVDINKSFKIQGCEIVNYLLEKSRVVKQSPNERNYHIFYFLLEGATAEMKRDLSLGVSSDYHFLSQSGCTKINNVDDAKEFADVVGAMQTLNFSQETQNAMFSVISAILHLGNVQFVSGGAEGSRLSPASSASLTTVARLLGVNLDSLTYCLTQKNVQMGKGSMVAMKLSPDQAFDGRDTLAKALFSNMFDWTIQKVNENLVCGPAPYAIGILDIFGFEVFEINSFEQLCINYR
jgi:myosin heavy subunit